MYSVFLTRFNCSLFNERRKDMRLELETLTAQVVRVSHWIVVMVFVSNDDDRFAKAHDQSLVGRERPLFVVDDGGQEHGFFALLFVSIHHLYFLLLDFGIVARRWCSVCSVLV